MYDVGEMNKGCNFNALVNIYFIEISMSTDGSEEHVCYTTIPEQDPTDYKLTTLLTND